MSTYSLQPYTTVAGTEVSIPAPTDEEMAPDLGIEIQWNNEDEAWVHKKTPILWEISLSWDFITEEDAATILDVIKTDNLEYIAYTCSVGVFHCRLETNPIEVTRTHRCDGFSMDITLKGERQ